MTKSRRKQRTEAAAKDSHALATEATKERAAKAAAVEAARATAENARAAEKAASESAAAARKALGPTPKALKVKKARHTRPLKRTPAAKTTSETKSKSAAGAILAHSVRKTMAKPGAKTHVKKGPGPQ